MTWHALVPQKALTRAKSRLGLPADQRSLLATAMLRDTLETLMATEAVTDVTVLWDERADAHLAPQVPGLVTTGLSLNQALSTAQHQMVLDDAGTVVVPGDLPALAPADLTECLLRAARAPESYLADAEGTGTTLLTAAPGYLLPLRFGPGSARAHALAGARAIDPHGLEAARTDVDDLASLARALGLGCGHHTLGACARLGLMLEPVPALVPGS
ncbi:MAG TPA: 2-phospho-L-lactate guanylyltransferase [Marmoricola sp.]|nr:2-phospho-L-lactate guanylyltransferase [Marmoricola sp.]